LGLGAGISQAGVNGQGWMTGVAPGLMIGANMTARDQQMMRAERDKQAQMAMMADYRRTQEDAMREKMRMAADQEKQRAAFGGQLAAMLGGGGVPGFNAQNPQGPLMGPPAEAGNSLMAYLTNEKGLPTAQAAAIVGNFQQESGFNPTQVHDNGTGYGLGGWRLDRRDALARYAQLRNGNISDPKLQADFMLDEIKTRPEYTAFSSAKSPEDATTALMNYFRPAGWTPDNPTAGNGYGNRVGYARTYAGAPGGPQIAQGDAIPGGGGVQGGAMPSGIASLPPEVRAGLMMMAQKDPEKALPEIIKALQNQKKEDAWYPLTADDTKMYLNLDANALKASPPMQRNKITGEIKPIGGSLVNINNQQESEFTKHIAAQDAKRIGEIQDNTKSILDTSAKVRMATDLLSRTYTGTGADYANEWFKTLGSLGVQSAAGKANAADAATSLINELTPKMRAPGSGATSDFEMRSFAAALPSMLKLPGGNEMVAKLWDRIAERQLAVQALAEKHAKESKALTGTTFAADVKGLGPLFTKDELSQMQELSKGDKPANQKPLSTILNDAAQNQTPMPANRKPLGSILGGPQ
jgi:hypothetical protein